MIYETSVILSRIYLKGGLASFVTSREYELMLYLAKKVAKDKNLKSQFLNESTFLFDDVKDFTVHNINIDISKSIFGNEYKEVKFISKEEFDKAVVYLSYNDFNFLLVVDHLVKLLDGFESSFGLELLAVVDCVSKYKDARHIWKKVNKFSDRQYNIAKSALQDYDKVGVN
jgi:hypothetical protein